MNSRLIPCGPGRTQGNRDPESRFVEPLLRPYLFERTPRLPRTADKTKYYDNYREISCGPHGFTPDLHCETSGEFQVALARNRPGDRCRHATPSCSSQPLGLIGGPEPGNAGEVFPAFTGIGPKWERHHTTPSSAFGTVQDQSQPSAKFRLQLFEPRGINQPNIQKIAEMGAVPVPKRCQLHPDQSLQTHQSKLVSSL